MRIEINRNEITKALASVRGACSSKAQIPALEGVLLTANGMDVSVTAYNLEYGITAHMQADTYAAEDGTIILPKLLLDAVKKLAGDVVEISTEGTNINVKCGRAKYTFAGLDPSDYPDLPTITSHSVFDISHGTLRRMIRQTVFSVATDNIRPVLTGVMFNGSDNALTLAALDGHRLAVAKTSVNNGIDCHFIVPADTLREIAKMLTDSEEKLVTIAPDAKHIIFETDGTRIFSRLIDGEFMDYAKSIPNTCATEVYIKVRDMMDAADRAELISNDQTKQPLRCEFNNGKLHVECISAIGSVSDTLDARTSGDSVTIGFNTKYLLDALKSCDTDEVKLLLNGGLSPMRIEPVSGDSFMFLVLPMRLKG